MRDVRHVAPVLLLTFNRPEPTQRVVEAIRRARPERVYIAADGPRRGHPTDRDRCRATRDVVTKVDWPCEIHTLFRDHNLGCGRAVSEALDWFFEAEDAGIVLEDDCLPSPTFFGFCTEQLERYADDPRIMLISGFNIQSTWRPETYGRYRYFFSHLGGIWGWASWRRAWKHFDFSMHLLDEALRTGALRNLLGDRLGRLREHQMQQVRDEGLDTWDYQWGLARNLNSGLSVVPVRSLVQNIGFAGDATHTHVGDPRARIIRQDIELPTRRNPIVVADRTYDRAFFRHGGLVDRVRAASGGWFPTVRRP